MSPLISILRKILQDRARERVPLSRYTTFRIGGPAEIFCEVHTPDELHQVWRAARDAGAPLHLLGGGSNLLVRDEGVKGVVIKLGGEFRQSRWDGCEVTVGAAEAPARLARQAAGRKLTGLEFAVAIPGSMGGALVMNAGTKLGEIADVLVEATLMDRDGDIAVHPPEDMGLHYRTSNLQQGGWVVLNMRLRLREGDEAEIYQKMARHVEERRRTQPLAYPSAGSVFKNPPGDYAGRLIEAAGLKGERCGGAEISCTHANFIVNVGGATAKDVLTLAARAKQAVREQFGIVLQEEIRIWG